MFRIAACAVVVGVAILVVSLLSQTDENRRATRATAVPRNDPAATRAAEREAEDSRDVPDAAGSDPAVDAPPRGSVVPPTGMRSDGPVSLRVVDAVTGRDLDEVEIVELAGFRVVERVHPGPTDRAKSVTTGATSPVSLSGGAGVRTLWVRAREHAWSCIRIASGQGGERLLKLQLAGTLQVRVRNLAKASDTKLRLYETGSIVATWLPSSDAVTRIESLRVGMIEVRAEIGDWHRDPLVLGQARVKVEAGAVTDLTLDLKDPPGPESVVPFAGTLHIDAGWKDRDFLWITAEGISVPKGAKDPDIRLDDHGRWTAGRVAPGRYALHVHPWTWCQLVDVGPNGNTSSRIVVPAPCDVDVRFLDETSGKPADVEALSWWMKRPRGGTNRTETPVSTGRFRFRSPIGRVEIQLSGDRYFMANRRAVVDLQPANNTFTFRVRRTCGLTIILKDGSMTVPIPDEFRARMNIYGIDDQQCRVLSETHGTTEHRASLSKPGRYRVMFLGDIDGYQPVDAKEVDVGDGEQVRLVIRLERRK